MHRRPTLTPSTVTPPSISTQTTSARSDRPQTSPDRATALLSRVASHPASRRDTPAQSPLPSPSGDRTTDQAYSSLVAGGDGSFRKADGSVNWNTCGQKADGYISFPDFERYRQGYEAVTAGGGNGQDRQSIRT